MKKGMITVALPLLMTSTAALASGGAVKGKVDVVSENVGVVFHTTSQAEPYVEDLTDPEQILVEVQKIDGNLVVRSSAKNTNTVDPGKLLLYVPAGYSIKAEGKNGSVAIQGSCYQTIDVTLVNGAIKSDCLATEQTNLVTKNGAVVVNGLVNQGTHKLITKNGAVKLNLDQQSSVDINATTKNGLIMYNGQRQPAQAHLTLDQGIASMITETKNGHVIISYDE